MDFVDEFRKGYRIMIIARKPEPDEFSMIAKITGAAILATGALGAVIALVFAVV
jgi:protein translocase SEC61 complex gamma subunit